MVSITSPFQPDVSGLDSALRQISRIEQSIEEFHAALLEHQEFLTGSGELPTTTGRDFARALVCSGGNGSVCEACDACRFIMDFLKTRAPFWKKEHPIDADAGGWVEANCADDSDAARWERGWAPGSDNVFYNGRNSGQLVFGAEAVYEF